VHKSIPRDKRKANVDERPEKNPEIIQCAGWKRQMQEAVQQDYPHLTPEEVTDKRKMSYRINIFKWIISHINI
jgi:hypothetical protein